MLANKSSSSTRKSVVAVSCGSRAIRVSSTRCSRSESYNKGVAKKQGEYCMMKQAICAGTAAMLSGLLWSGGEQAAYAAMCPQLTRSESGLEFCDVKEGDGDTPVKGAFIKVHYSGRLDSDSASGTFDSSYDRGRPLGFAVGTGQVIKGWDQGILGDGKKVPGMKPGGKRQLVIPPGLGYGERGAGGGIIPPNATLYFDVEYLGRLGQK